MVIDTDWREKHRYVNPNWQVPRQDNPDKMTLGPRPRIQSTFKARQTQYHERPR